MCPSRQAVLFAVSCLLVLAVGLFVYAQAPAAPAAPAPVAPKPAVVAPAPAAAAEVKDIVATVAADPDLKTLSKAIDAAGLAELKGKGPMTLLAPNDKAMAAAYPGEKLDALLKDKAQVSALVLCLLVPDKAVAVADLKGMKDLTCAAKHKHAVAVVEGAVTIDGAKVVKADVKASNGLVQVLDKVAMPAMAAAPAAAPAAAAPAVAPRPVAPAPAPAPAPAR